MVAVCQALVTQTLHICMILSIDTTIFCIVVSICRFAEYRKDDPQSFMLHSNLQYFPQFMFNLRRSQFVQVFGVAPDETASHRLVLFKMPVLDALVSCVGGGSSCSSTLLCTHR